MDVQRMDLNTEEDDVEGLTVFLLMGTFSDDVDGPNEDDDEDKPVGICVTDAAESS
jgi:hypothetical protein